MLGFDVRRNGRRLTRAGIGRGTLMAVFSWRTPPEGTGAKHPLPSSLVPGMEARVWGDSTRSGRRRERASWVDLTDVRLGDEFVIRVTELSRADKPRTVERYVFPKDLCKCSFCGVRRATERRSGVPGVAVGRKAAVCSQCVFIAAAMLERKNGSALHLRRLSKVPCSFCGRSRGATMVGTSRAAMCDRCIARFQLAF